MRTPHLDELLRRLRMDDPTATLDVDRRASGTLVHRPPDLDHPLVIVVREDDLAAAVTALGEESRDALWPGSTVAEAGFNLLLVHLDEVVATRETSEPLRITGDGLVWPEEARPSQP